MPRVAFVIAGAQKGGTTALHAFLGQHPGVFMPALKELHYFDKREKLPDRLGLYWRYHRHFRGAAREAILGEATSIYMFWPGVAARMARYNPPHAYTGLERVIRPRPQDAVGSMAPEDRAFLDRYFAAEVAALSGLLSRDLSHWSSVR